MGNRRYTKREKLAAVLAADVSGLTATAEATGIPKSTLVYWTERPEFVQFRTKAREDLADEVKVVAHLAWQRAAEALRDGTMEPRDVLFAAEKATNLQLLMSGEATIRSETVSVTDGLDPAAKRALRDRLARAVRGESVAGGTEGNAVGVGDGVDSASTPDSA